MPHAMKTVLAALLIFTSVASYRNGYDEVEDKLFNMLPSGNGKCAEEFARLGKCLAPQEPILNLLLSEVDVDDNLLYNPAIMKHFVTITANVSDCFGEAQCEDTKFLKHLATQGVFIGQKVYGDAFHCFINADVVGIANKCEERNRPTPEQARNIFNKSDYDAVTEPLLSCTFRELRENPSCTSSRVEDLVFAAVALSDMYYEILMNTKQIGVRN